MTIERAYRESKNLFWYLFRILDSYRKQYVSSATESTIVCAEIDILREKFENEFERIENNIVPDRQFISYNTPALDFDGDVVSMKAIMKDRERIRELETEVDKLKKANSKEILHDENGNIIW